MDFSFRAGSLVSGLAQDDIDIHAAQRLRYRVFYEEYSAKPTEAMLREQRDFDFFDPYCDHILVIDESLLGREDRVVGNYRLMRHEGAQAAGRFYSSAEYDLGCLLNYGGKLLELGRSCIDRRYRNSAVLSLLWRSIAHYMSHYGIELTFGCASLPGTDQRELAPLLSYLYHYHLAPPALRVRAHPEIHTEMNCLSPEDFDRKTTMANLPPLVRAYVRVNGCFGDGAVVDSSFNTTDVCAILETEEISKRYYRRYAREFDDSQAEDRI